MTSTPCNSSLKLTHEMSTQTDEDRKGMACIPYREAVGSLMYLMIGSRPDIAYVVSNVSRFMEYPGQQHWNSVKYIFRYLRSISKVWFTFLKIIFRYLQNHTFDLSRPLITMLNDGNNNNKLF